MKTVQLKQFRTPQEIVEIINEAHSAFQKEFKRSPKLQLALSESGQPKRPQYFVAAWYENEVLELEWFKQFLAQ